MKSSLPGDDPRRALIACRLLTDDHLPWVECKVIALARREGWSWRRIAQLLMRSRQSVFTKHRAGSIALPARVRVGRVRSGQIGSGQRLQTHDGFVEHLETLTKRETHEVSAFVAVDVEDLVGDRDHAAAMG